MVSILEVTPAKQINYKKQMNNNETTIKLNELSIEQLDKLTVTLSIQLAKMELEKTFLLQDIYSVSTELEKRKHEQIEKTKENKH